MTSRYPGGPASIDALAGIEPIVQDKRQRQQRALAAVAERGWNQIACNAQCATCAHPERKDYLFVSTTGHLRIGRTRATAKPIKVDAL